MSQTALFTCDRVPTKFKMNPTIFVIKCFETNVKSFTIATEGCILDTAEFKMKKKYLPSLRLKVLIHNFYANFCFLPLKLVSTIFYEVFIFYQMIALQKLWKCFLFHRKSSFRSQDIQAFVVFPLPFHTFHIQKDKSKWNNLWCHELPCINLQM